VIALVIAVGLLDGCPVPRGANQHRRMVERLGPDLAALVDRVDQVRRVALRPFSPLAGLVRIDQRWKLFVGAPPRVHRMWIEVRGRGDATWRPLFVAGDDRHDFLADRLTYRRVRGVWNPHPDGTRVGYPAFATWVAGQVFARMPEVYEVQVSMEPLTVGPRGGVHATGVRRYHQLRRRPEPR